MLQQACGRLRLYPIARGNIRQLLQAEKYILQADDKCEHWVLSNRRRYL